ncbi:hypothetical protein EAO75_08255 [Streptomyces sp. uw30]|uniref:hypothetical protein n=1 Tax=Streptomyces sp. uw30 TaxID=1828179 RepID=UPI0011CD898B|nr:hypothetical protein [Streptomyces sp. uw30]TXS52508.1 hypothetical protein EAO75_08255 [Streptomyces sp. uw30]
MTALDPRTSERIAGHLRRCPACADEAAQLMATLSTLRSVPSEVIVGDWGDKVTPLREAAVRSVVDPD